MYTCSLERLREFADDIDYQMLLDKNGKCDNVLGIHFEMFIFKYCVVLQEVARLGDPENGIGPIDM